MRSTITRGVTKETKRLTLKDLNTIYQSNEKLVMLTAYDTITAQILDIAEIELILVGDSLGNVILGYDTTIPVTLNDMIRHTQAVMRGTKHAFVICDLPFGKTTDPETTLKAAIQVFQKTQCQAVKLEGGKKAAPTVKRLVTEGIPVMGHIGLVPQSIHQLGGYSMHGQSANAAQELLESAIELQAAGAFAIVLECILPEVAQKITEKLKIPTIGIGSGNHCSGQVLVINDLIGLNIKPLPKFVKPKANVAGIIKNAVSEYIAEVKTHKTEENLCPPPPSTGYALTSETRTQ
ncbi:3-methyl-2-oxobutanoate hydroxymethyltransferase [Candidatus Nomurabacteria bacterium]|nr:3-methyl-2-oxobutanoate hydroxymethyltransferase [Candidatus Nomurabacteria bacterium]